MDQGWPAEDVTRARELWDEGLSLAQIGHAIGRSKASVARCVQRSGFPTRPVPPGLRAKPKAPSVAMPALTGFGALQRAGSGHDAVLFRHCQWVTGERPWRFCEAPPHKPGSAWCRHHVAIVYHSRPRERAA